MRWAGLGDSEMFIEIYYVLVMNLISEGHLDRSSQTMHVRSTKNNNDNDIPRRYKFASK